MSESRIQNRIWYGYGKAAQHLGQSYTQTRWTGTGSPLTNVINPALTAAFDSAATFNFQSPSKYGKYEWFGLFDPTYVQVGDYLQGPIGTFFVASIEPLHPPLCVLCNYTVNVTRPSINAATTAGALPIGQDTAATEEAILTGWPCAILYGVRSEASDVNLPTDSRLAGFQVAFPLVSGVTIRNADFLTDATGLRRLIIGVETTARGLRLTTVQETS